MSKFAKSLDHARDLLMKGEETQEDDIELEDDEEGEEENVDKAQEIDLEKAEDASPEMGELIQADEFMASLAQNQTDNAEKLAKAIENDQNATMLLLKAVGDMGETINELTEKVDAIGSVPQPRRAALSKSEAQQALDGATERAPITDPTPADVEVPSLTKGVVVEALNAAALEGKCDVSDVMKAEATGGGGHMKNIPIQAVFPGLSEGGKTVVRKLIADLQE